MSFQRPAEVDSPFDLEPKAGSGPHPKPEGPGSRFPRALSALQAWLATGAARRWLIALSLFLGAFALPTGPTADDDFHAVALREDASLGTRRAAWDLFAFAKNPETIQQMIDEGIFPWWSDTNAKFSFFRPLASLSTWLDHRLWPDSPALMHAHSLAWFGLLLFFAAQVYRRLSSAPAAFAGLALALYALDDARPMTTSWLANRSAIMALTFGFATLVAHDSWRKTRKRRLVALATASLGVGLFCAEAAVQAFGYLLAYALFLDEGKPLDRARSLLPYVAVVVVWRSVYLALGYGATRTGLYIDPASDPLRFLEATLLRFPILLSAQLGPMWADLPDLVQPFSASLASVFLPACLLFLALAAWLFTPLLRTSKEARFWATGTLFATLPVCALSPSDRLLTATALGGSGLLALFLLAVANRDPAYRRRVAGWAAVALSSFHLIIAPLLAPVRAYSFDFLGQFIDRAERSIPSGPEVAQQTVVLLNPISDPYGIYVPIHRQRVGRTMPKHLRWLATGTTALHVKRVDDFSLKIRPEQGFLPEGSIWTLRDRRTRSFVGETVRLTGVTFQVTEVTEDGRPGEVLVRFEQPLESEHFVWLRWGKTHFVPFSLPKPGKSVVIPAIDVWQVSAPAS